MGAGLRHDGPAVGERLAIRQRGRWEPVRVIDRPSPDQAQIVYEGYFSLSYRPGAFQDVVPVAALQPRQGRKLYWHSRRVLAWAAVVTVIAGGAFLGGFVYLTGQHEEGPPPTESPRRFQKGEAVSISWQGSWYPGRILEVRDGGRYLVTYDGWGEEYDEVVDGSRLRRP